MRRRIPKLAALASLVVAAAVLVLAYGRRAWSADEAAPTAAGDPSRGRALLHAHGCAACHTIPGVRGATATVGPPLDRIARRVYVGGRVNTRANVVDFLQRPTREGRASAMPDVGVDEREAEDIAAFLETLR